MIWCSRVYVNLGLGSSVARCTKAVYTRLGRCTPTRGGGAWWRVGGPPMAGRRRRVTEHCVPSYDVFFFSLISTNNRSEGDETTTVRLVWTSWSRWCCAQQLLRW
ncbi:hypothetical protein V6N11_019022 [Hibiscus sabdariffa]|uniref:Secreted protein n=1 Tax=Hibiscus sabdariffa TaxID=183260 RepID=A0ABR2R139_9ROSI